MLLKVLRKSQPYFYHVKKIEAQVRKWFPCRKKMCI